MKLLYTHENNIIVENARNILCENGIESELRNEFAAGGIGELSPMQTWPELWVEEAQYLRAKDVIQQLNNSEPSNHWVCAKCGEENAGTFEICWHCQSDKPH